MRKNMLFDLCVGTKKSQPESQSDCEQQSVNKWERVIKPQDELVRAYLLRLLNQEGDC